MTGVHPRLVEAFGALDAAGVRWCLLRGRSELDAPAGDVDLLLHPADATRARRAFGDAEMPALRVWAGGRQSFFLGWDRDSELWVYVHAVTELSFGPFHGLRLHGMDGVLARLERSDGVPMPAPSDRFWITLLHGLVDKGRLDPRHRAALTELAPFVDPRAGLAVEVDRIASPGSGPSALLDGVRAARWEDLERAAETFRTHWGRRDPAAAVRAARHRASLLIVKIREISTRRGMGVALLAPDGGGKSRLAMALPAALYFPVRRFYMGLEGGPFANAGPSLLPGSGMLRRLAHLWRNWIEARYHQARRRCVVFERYPYEALLPAPEGAGLLSLARRAVLGHALPVPDVVLVLDAPGEVLYQRKGEHSPEGLERDRRGYLRLAERLPQATVLDATRPFAEVRRDATAAVWRAYRRRLGSR